MADAPDSKSGVLRDVGVQLPPPAPLYKIRGEEMNKQRLVLTLICITLSFTVFLTAFESNVFAGMVGESAPEFRLKDLKGNEVSLSSFKGKPVLLNFWMTWCHFCKKERKELDALYKAYKDKDLVIIAVALDKSKRVVKNFIKNHPAEYIVLSDTEMTAGRMYGVRGYPTTFLIDRDGIVKYKFSGARAWSSSVSGDIIDKLIK